MEIENLKIDLEDLQNAYTNIVEAMNNINEIDGLSEEYKQLDLMLQTFENKRIEIENELENLEEEAYYKENEQQWKAEKKEQEREYWSSQF